MGSVLGLATASRLCAHHAAPRIDETPRRLTAQIRGGFAIAFAFAVVILYIIRRRPTKRICTDLVLDIYWILLTMQDVVHFCCAASWAGSIATGVRARPMMMRRIAGRVFWAVGGRAFGTGRGRLAHLLPPGHLVGLEYPMITPRDGEGKRWGGALLRPPARHGEVGGLLITTTRTQNRARLTFRVDAHIDARNRFVVAGLHEQVPSARLRLVVFRPFDVGRVVVLGDPPARRFQDAAAGSRRDTKGPAAAAAAAAAAAGEAGLLS